MPDFPSKICPHCSERIGNRLFVRDRGDDQPEHFDCHQRTRREAVATATVLPKRRPNVSLLFDDRRGPCVSCLRMKLQTMHQRLTISHPAKVDRTTKARLRRVLIEGYRRRADEDRQLAAEWDHLSAEVWAQLDRAEKR